MKKHIVKLSGESRHNTKVNKSVCPVIVIVFSGSFLVFWKLFGDISDEDELSGGKGSCGSTQMLSIRYFPLSFSEVSGFLTSVRSNRNRFLPLRPGLILESLCCLSWYRFICYKVTTKKSQKSIYIIQDFWHSQPEIKIYQSTVDYGIFNNQKQ